MIDIRALFKEHKKRPTPHNRSRDRPTSAISGLSQGRSTDTKLDNFKIAVLVVDPKCTTVFKSNKFDFADLKTKM